MFNLKKWLHRKHDQSLPHVYFSNEWIALENSLQTHDFGAISTNLRSWCILPESNINMVLASAESALFSKIEIRKLGFFYEYYTSNKDNTFELTYTKIQQHIQEYGFDADLHVIGLVCLYQSDQFEAAAQYQRQLNDADAFAIHRADYWQMVSVIRWANNDMVRLEQAVDRTLELAPEDCGALQTALAMYIELGATEKIGQVRAKIASKPECHGYAHSLCLLALGEQSEGWRQMEARYDIEDAHRYLNLGLKTYQRWRGEPLLNQCLLISAEQGLGDTIQMARYIPLLGSIGVNRVVIESQPETLTLLQHNFPAIQIVERLWSKAPSLDFGLWIGMMSLPFHLKSWGEKTPGRSGYLVTPPEVLDYWQARVTELARFNRPRIGLAWSGQPTHRADRRRSIPFHVMSEYVQGIQATFFALQTKVPESLPANVINVSEEMITLADTAALIEQMDLVITVDTSVVHIAGALGKEAWLLLPKRYEWRWGLEGETNDWYDSVKVIRQTEHANWQQVLTDVFKRRLPARFNY